MIKNQEPETPPSPLHLPPPPPWSSERARCELARSSVLGIFIMIIVTIIKHGDYFKHCFLYDQDVCMYLHIVTKQGKDPSTKRKGKRQRWHSGLKVNKVGDTLRQTRKCLFSDVEIDHCPYLHELPPTHQCLRIGVPEDNSVFDF